MDSVGRNMNCTELKAHEDARFMQLEFDKERKKASDEFVAQVGSNPFKIDANTYLSFEGVMPSSGDKSIFALDVILIGTRFKPEFGGLVLFCQLVILADSPEIAAERFSRLSEFAADIHDRVAEGIPKTMSIDLIIPAQ